MQLIFTAIIVAGIIGRNFVVALRKVPHPRARKVPAEKFLTSHVCKMFSTWKSGLALTKRPDA
jgi:hypothetical protein